MKTSKIKTILFPLLAALIWGTAFVAQSVSADYVGAFTFNAARSTIAAIVLGVGLWVYEKFLKPRVTKTEPQKLSRQEKKTLLIGGFCCGFMLFIASNFQQFGLADTSPGKAGFITSLYIVIVPLLGIFLKKKVPAMLWVSVVIAVAGLYLLCIKGDFSMATSDLMVLVCALFFALHILVIDRFVGRTDPVKLSCVQFAAAAILSWIAALIYDHPTWVQLEPCLGQILYVGVFSSAVAYTLQVVAQKDANPVTLSLLLSLESVFSVLAGAVLLQERMAGKEYIGCLLMLCAVMLAQLPSDWYKKILRRKA